MGAALLWPMVVVLLEAFLFVLTLYLVWTSSRSHNAEWPAAEVGPTIEQEPATRERESALPEGELAHTA